MKIWRLFVCISVFFLVACAPQAVSRKDSSPPWIQDPSLPGYLAVVASAMPQNIGGVEGQRRTVLTKARAELAKSVRVHVRDVLKVQQTTRNGSAALEAANETEVSALAAQRLDRASIRAEWTDPQSGELFFWYVTPAQ